MTPKVVYRIYIASYFASTVMLLWGAWVDGGLRQAMLAFVGLLFVSLIMGPYLFFRILNKREVWIPRVGWYGPNSSEEERWIYSLVVGALPVVFFLIALAT